MIALTVEQIATAVGGVLSDVDPQTFVVDVVKDSHEITAGSMFVAIAGERVDGHEFATDAIAAGSVVVLSARPLVDAAGVSLPCIVVDDPVTALGSLASWVRQEFLDCTVIALTGSSGKTSTKDLVASVLATVADTVSAVGSQNTEVTVPLTILAADQSTRFLVLEMGMRGLGHIAYLASTARPEVAAVLNVGTAHLGMLGTRSAIADAKAELIDALPDSAVAVLNADDPVVAAMAKRTLATIVTFGEAAEASVRAVDVRLDGMARPSFTLVDQRDLSDLSAHVSLQVSGRHQVSNATAAAAIALSVGMDIGQVASALSAATARSKWRMEVSESATGITVVNDAYNANPDSMRAALDSLAAMSIPGRSWAVLGEMRELGDESQSEHEAVGRLVVSLGISCLVCVGDGTLPMQRAAVSEPGGRTTAVYVPDVEVALEILRRDARSGDAVLVKASRSVGLERLAIALLDGAAT